MIKKIIFLLTIICCGFALPSYTNSCAKPDAAFLKADQCRAAQEEAARSVRPARAGLEVFPLELISIQL